MVDEPKSCLSWGQLVSGTTNSLNYNGSYIGWGVYSNIWCPMDSTDTELCNKITEKGYGYGSFYYASANKYANICPVGWHLPSSDEWTGLNSDSGGTESPTLKSGKWNNTIMNNNNSYWSSENGEVYSTNEIFTGRYVRITAANSYRFEQVTHGYSWFWSRPIRCVRD